MISASLILRLAVRNLLTQRGKSAAVALIVAFCGFAMVFVSAMLGTMGKAMKDSLIGTVTGDLQVYSASAKDRLLLYGTLNYVDRDFGYVHDFDRVQEALGTIKNIARVVPMGGGGSSVAYMGSPGALESAVEELRDAVKERSADRQKAAIERVQDLVGSLENDLAPLPAGIGALAVQEQDEGRAIAHHAGTPEFWAAFDRDPEQALDYLENRVLPLGADSNRLFVPFLGVDFEKFAKGFPRFHIVKGETIPSGGRGLLVNERVYETMFKHALARGLDEMHDMVVEDKRRFQDSAELQSKLLATAEAARETATEFTRGQRRAISGALRDYLKRDDSSVDVLLAEFLRLDDDNFEARYRMFYDKVAPNLDLYRIRFGQDVVLRFPPRYGLPTAVKIPFRGTYEFSGVNGSPVAQHYSLVDPTSMRTLIGFATPEKETEFASIRHDVGVEYIDRTAIEARLFEGPAERQDPAPRIPLPNRPESPESVQQTTSSEIVPFAALVLRDPAEIDKTRAEIKALAKEKGLQIQTASWDEVSGTARGLISIFWLLASIAFFALLAISIVIINNTVVMMVVERFAEFGVLRAIGADRGFVRVLLLTEVALIGVAAGVFADGLGELALFAVRHHGIGAGTSEILRFVFGGSRLFPHSALWQLIVMPLIPLLTAILAAIQPIRLATRIQPVEAMGREI